MKWVYPLLSVYYSRMTFGITLVLYFILSYTTRLGWKRVLASGKWGKNSRSLLIVTTKAEAKKVVETVQANNYGTFLISGLVIVDKDMTGQSIAGVNVIANSEDAPMYVCQQWIDITCQTPAKKYKLYKSSINKSIHFVQRSLSSSTRG